MEKREHLSACPLFAGLEESALARLAAVAREIRLPPGKLLFQKGDPGDALFVIVRGSVRVVARSREGDELRLNQLGASDYLGEIALFDGRTRTADAVAAEATEVLCITRRGLLEVVGEHPDIAARLMERLCAHLRRATDGLEDRSFHTAPQRLARTVLQLLESETHGEAGRGEISLSLTQADLGERTGLSRVSVNQILQGWKHNGWIEIARGRLVIRDASALAALIAE